MEILQQKRALDVITDLFLLRPGKSQYVKTMPQKAPFPGGITQHAPLPRRTPEEMGMESGGIEKLFLRLCEDEDVNLHSIMILRHGAVIAEMSRRPYSTRLWHVTHSVCKTVTVLAVGMLIDEGKLSLDDDVISFFPEVKTVPFSKYKSIKVDHLLSMSSGVSFAEIGSVTDEDWVRGFFESAVKFEPGSEFAYNSMNSYILSAIVTKLTGQTMSEFLLARLWSPLGITTYHWETCPKEITKGGWGLYLLPEDMAKLGELILHRGQWRGKRIVSEAWIGKMSEKTFDTPHDMGKYGYARHLWCGARPGSVVCNGLFGQNIIVYPDIDVVVVTTAANDALFQTCRMTDIIEEFFLCDRNFYSGKLPENKTAEESLRRFCRSMSEYEPKKVNKKYVKRGLFGRIFAEPTPPAVPDHCKRQSGKEYKLGAENVSLLPLLTQVIANNYDVGVDTVGFEYNEDTDKFTVVFTNSARTTRVPVGFDSAEYFDYNLNGEMYKLAVAAEMTKNEDNVPVLKLRVACLELAAERRIKIFFNRNGSITVKWSELPGRRLIIDAVGSVVKPALNKPILSAIAAKTDGDFLLYRLDRMIEPTTTGVPIPKP